MIYLGIDLGTTFSLVAYMNPHGVPTLFPDYHNVQEFRTASVVHVGEEGGLVGTAVEEILEDEPDFAHVRFVKLQMGEGKTAFWDHLKRGWLPESLSAVVLKKLLKDVRSISAEEIGGVVVTVPANFSDAQRQATRHAAVMAGLPSPVLIDEPVAAATYYGLSDVQTDQTLFVYDLGGGTFDATVLQSSQEGLYALATEGNNSLGGKSIDEIIMKEVATEFERQYGFNPMSDPMAQEQLRRFAESTKLKLCQPAARQVRKTLLLAGKTLDFVISRAYFEQLISELVDETLQVSEHCLQGAGLDWDMVDKVLLTGGSSLLPLIKERITGKSGMNELNIISRQPHQAVVFGAAMVAQQYFEARSEKILQTISAWDLGIRVMDKKSGQPAVKVMIDKNTPVPANENTEFFTTRDDQTRMIIEVVQQKEEEEKSLGYFAFGPIENPKKNYPVEITLAYDVQGMVRVTAKDKETGKQIEQILNDEAIEMDDRHAQQQSWLEELVING